MRFYWSRVEASRNFANKVWNASRFILMNLDAADVPEKIETSELTLADRWILSGTNEVIREVTANMEKFELGIAVGKVYDFIWDEFCDWYIEMVKPRLYSKDDATKGAALWTLKYTLNRVLKLLHPFMPFITEEIYCTLNENEETIMTADYPKADNRFDFTVERKQTEMLKEAVRGIRNVRTELNVPLSRKTSVYVVSSDAATRKTFEDGSVFFGALARAETLFIQDRKEGVADDAVSANVPGAEIYIPLDQLVDLEKEKARLAAEQERLSREIARCEGLLGNEKFVSKAPAAKVETERAKLADYRQMMRQVSERIARLVK